MDLEKIPDIILDDHILESYDLVSDDLTFDAAKIDKKLEKLQLCVVEFMTSLILRHETEFYNFVNKFFPNDSYNLLCNTHSSIITMITEVTEKFYNNLYRDIQNNIDNEITKLIKSDFCPNINYGIHILLDKLFRFTYDAHIEISREELVYTHQIDVYLKSVLTQLNLYLQTKNILHIMAKGPGEDTEFVNIPESATPFKIIIDSESKSVSVR